MWRGGYVEGWVCGGVGMWRGGWGDDEVEGEEETRPTAALRPCAFVSQHQRL